MGGDGERKGARRTGWEGEGSKRMGWQGRKEGWGKEERKGEERREKGNKEGEKRNDRTPDFKTWTCL